VNPGGGPDVDRPRDAPALIREGLRLLAQRPLGYLGIGLAFAVPIQLVVSGVGLEQLTAPYDEQTSPVELVVGTLASFVVITPLVSAACALLATGGASSAGRAILRALEHSTPLLLAAMAAALGVALGLLCLLLPGLYLVVRWFLFSQAAVLEGRTGVAPLRRSGQLVEGHWFRAAAVVLVANLIALLPGSLITIPGARAASELGREWPNLAATILSEAVSAPIVAVLATLLFFDLKARQAQPF
jgi:hypothetical protein